MNINWELGFKNKYKPNIHSFSSPLPPEKALTASCQLCLPDILLKWLPGENENGV